MADLDLYSKEDLKKILVTWYGPQADNWEMNDQLANLTLEIIYKTGACSDLFNMLPQPYNPFSSNPIKSIGMQYVKKIFKSLADNKESLVCIKGTAYGYATKMKESAQGL